ncbi:MAG TPA: hypothetical protein VG992_02280 [Candidatus Saccharimonadales bacterium]|nr:hypothetical protein [Candidatus Saccharimonadales bacterium]
MTVTLEKPIGYTPDHLDPPANVDHLLAELRALSEHEAAPSRPPTTHDMHVGHTAVGGLGELQQAANDASQHEQAVADLREIQDSAPAEVH